ncbi:MAG TPA: hypothetical protein P5081_07115 [Phycisphaerae bacterium]|nr:hypothetical protein [Phycisphaerae bacterium]HRW52640.1 hypothetical protein [Phycisphaerae bacterium]
MAGWRHPIESLVEAAERRVLAWRNRRRHRAEWKAFLARDDVKRLLTLAEEGKPPVEVCAAGQGMGLGFMDCMKVLAKAFNLKPTESKECYIKAQGYASLSDYQATLIEPLEAAFRMMEAEDAERDAPNGDPAN